jgi:hypothetical protein
VIGVDADRNGGIDVGVWDDCCGESDNGVFEGGTKAVERSLDGLTLGCEGDEEEGDGETLLRKKPVLGVF